MFLSQYMSSMLFIVFQMNGLSKDSNLSIV